MDIDHDALWEQAYSDQDRTGIKKIAADNLMDAGSYMKVGTAFVTKKVDEKTGRPSARVMVRLATLNDPEKVVGIQFFSLSPVRVNRKTKEGEDTGKPDTASLLYQQTFNLFKKMAGREPENPTELLSFLEDQPYRVRVIQLGTDANSGREPGNMVVAISAAE